MEVQFSGSKKVTGYNKQGNNGELKYSINSDSLESITIEFLFKSNIKNSTVFILGGSTKEKEWISPLKLAVNENYLFLTVSAQKNDVINSSKVKVLLNGDGIMSPDIFYDNQWHHFVVNYSLKEGICQLYIDGQSSEEYKITRESFKSSLNLQFKGEINPSSDARLSLDQIAIYRNQFDSINHIVTHYCQVKEFNQYDFCSDPTEVSETNRVEEVDTLEFPLNYKIDGDNSQVNDILIQFSNFPVPRYKYEHNIRRNFPWIDYHYVGGRGMPGLIGNYDSITKRALKIQTELVKNWNYNLTVFPSRDITSLEGQFNLESNKFPDIPAGLRLNWNHINPNKFKSTFDKRAYIKNKALRQNYYFFENEMSKSAFYRSTSNLDPLRIDGVVQLKNLMKSFHLLTRPIDLINENGEIPALSFNNLHKGTIGKDSIESMKSFLSSKVSEIRNLYKTELLNHAYLKNTAFSYYSIDGLGGHSGYKIKYDWSIIKNINEIEGRFYSTMDYYPLSSYWWRKNSGAYHGYNWVEDARKIELLDGDKLFSPFICAGWKEDPRKNIRPAQYLALCKSFVVLGAEFFYSAYFNDVAPEFVVQDPKNWIWQIAIPSYAQALITRAEPIFFEGDVLKDYSGKYVFDVPDDLVTSLNVVREWIDSQSNVSHFLITSSIQTRSNKKSINNYVNKVVHLEKTGNLPSLTLNSNPQGSTYLLEIDNLGMRSPVFYCIDSWHEPSHPERWSHNIVFEAEVYDYANKLIRETNNSMGQLYALENLDFTQYTTYVRCEEQEKYLEFDPAFAPFLKYYFQPRNGSDPIINSTLNLRMCKKFIDESCKMLIEVSEIETNKVIFKKMLNVDIDDFFDWYSIDLHNLMFPLNSNVDYSLTITLLDNQLKIDQIKLSLNEKEKTEYMHVAEYQNSEVEFDVLKTCGTEIYIDNRTYSKDTTCTFSYTISKNWLKSLKSGKKLVGPCVKNKYMITGKGKPDSGVDLLWWNSDFNSSLFDISSLKSETVYVKLELFEHSKRIGKLKKKITIDKLPSFGINVSKNELCSGDTLLISKKFNSDSIVNVSWNPSLFLLTENQESGVFLPNRTGMIYIKGQTKQGCVLNDSVKVIVNPANMKWMNENHIKICEGETGPIKLSSSVKGGRPPYTFNWKEVYVQQIVEQDSAYFIGDGKTLLTDELIELEITDQDGCRIKDYLFLQVEDDEKCK